MTTVRSEGSTVYVEGDLDYATAAALHDALGLVADDGEEPVVIDLTAAEMVDTGGVSALLVARRRMRRRVVVRVGDSPARRVLEIAGVAELLDLG